MSKYKYSVDLISGLRPKNNADFPLVRAHDVQSRDDGTRLDAELEMLRAGSAAIYAGTVTATDTGNGNVLGNLGVAISLTQGAAYKVTFNGKDYKCVGSKEDVYPYLGNAHFLNDSREDTGEPFCLMFATNTTYLKTNAAGSYTLIIYEATSGGAIAITEVTSPDQITADSPDGFYIVPGGEGGGGSTGCTPIHYYDSLAAVPADLPEGSFVAVPSSDVVRATFDFSNAISLPLALRAPGGIVSYTISADTHLYKTILKFFEEFNKGAVDIGIDLGGFAFYITIYPQMVSQESAWTTFMIWDDELGGALAVYISFYTTAISYIVHKVSTAPMVP